MNETIKIFGFSHMLSNEKIILQLKNAIQNKKIPHAFIITGEKGMGKKALAGAFSKTLQCLDPVSQKTGEACGFCKSCLTFDSYNHPDIFWVKGTKKSIGVDDIRQQITAQMEIKPYAHPYKIFIMDEAETMTTEAQNALLKTIEEPASFGVFLFLATHKERFLPTMLSRCAMLSMQPIPAHILKEKIQADFALSETAANMLYFFSNGNLGRAITLATDTEFIALKTILETQTEKIITEKNLMLAFSMADQLKIYRHRQDDILDILLYYCREKMLTANFPPIQEQYRIYIEHI